MAVKQVIYMATVGNDVLPVMAGFLWCQERLQADEKCQLAILILETLDDERWRQQHQRFIEWLQESGVKVQTQTYTKFKQRKMLSLAELIKTELIKTELDSADFNSADLDSADLDSAQIRLVANVTGGNKLMLFHVMQIATQAGAKVIVVDAHSSTGGRVREVDSDKVWEMPQLNLWDVLKVYLGTLLKPSKSSFYAVDIDSHIAQNFPHYQAALALFKQIVQKRGGQAVRLIQCWEEDDLFMVALAGSKLLVCWLPKTQVGSTSPKYWQRLSSQTELRAFRQRLREMGGQLAEGFLPPAIPPKKLSQTDDQYDNMADQVIKQQRGFAEAQDLLLLEKNLSTSPVKVKKPEQRPPDDSTRAWAEVPFTLVCLVGAQIMPFVRDYLRLVQTGQAIDRVVLLRGDGPNMLASVGRLRQWLLAPLQEQPNTIKTPEVMILNVSADDLQQVRHALTWAVKHSEFSVVNVSGGTSLMALNAVRTDLPAQKLSFTYTDKRQIITALNEEVLDTPDINLPVSTLLMLHGVGFSEGQQPPVIKEVVMGATQLAFAETNADRSHFLNKLKQLWQQHLPQNTITIKEGTGAEYLVYAKVKELFPAADVWMDVILTAQSWDTRQQKDTDILRKKENKNTTESKNAVCKETDVILAWRGELLLLEVKTVLDKAFGNSKEHLDTGRFAEELGRYARIGVVGAIESNEPTFVLPKEAKELIGIKQTYWVIRPKYSLPEGVGLLANIASIFEEASR